MPHTSDRDVMVASSSAQVDVKAKGEKDAPTARPARRTSRPVSLEVDSAANVNPASPELPDQEEEHQYLEVDAGANILQQELLTRRRKEQRLLAEDEASDEDSTLGFARRERTLGGEKVVESLLHASTVAAAGAPAQPHGQALVATASALAPAAQHFTTGGNLSIILAVLITLVILALLVLAWTLRCLLSQDESGSDDPRPRSSRSAQARRGSIQRLLAEGISSRSANSSAKSLLFRDEVEEGDGMGIRHLSSLRAVEYDETREREFLKKEPVYVLPESKGTDYMLDEASAKTGFIWRLAKAGTKSLPLGGSDDVRQAILTNGLQDMKFWKMRYGNLKKDSGDGMIFSYMSEKLDMEPMSFILKPFAVASRSENSKRKGSTSMVYSQKIGCISTTVNPDDEKIMLSDFQTYQIGFDKDAEICEKLEKLPKELHLFYIRGLRKEEDPPQQCASCGYQVTFHPTHCCVACAKEPGTHGGRCQQKPMPDRVEHTEDFGVFATASKEDCEAWLNLIDASCTGRA